MTVAVERALELGTIETAWSQSDSCVSSIFWFRIPVYVIWARIVTPIYM